MKYLDDLCERLVDESIVILTVALDADGMSWIDTISNQVRVHRNLIHCDVSPTTENRLLRFHNIDTIPFIVFLGRNGNLWNFYRDRAPSVETTARLFRIMR